jgi:phospholipase C
VRRSCPLPYQLSVDGKLTKDRKRFVIQLAAGDDVFGQRAAGSPFTVYAPQGPDDVRVRNYAVKAGDRLEDSWLLSDFIDGRYWLAVYGPNGFYREFRGSADDPRLEIVLTYSRGTKAGRPFSGDVEIELSNRDDGRPYMVEVADVAYKSGTERQIVAPGDTARITFKTRASFGWHDLRVRINEHPSFEKRYAGRVETGEWSFSDPVMGRAVT